jgi:hypothetical protein
MRRHETVGKIVAAKAFTRLATTLPLITLAALPVAAQSLAVVKFPSVQQTQITDCSTPTILTLNGGQTLTLRGGQFIHYSDSNFDGTMYASSSAAGCQQLTFSTGGASAVDLYGRPVITISLSFSRRIVNFAVSLYNFLGGSVSGGSLCHGQRQDDGSMADDVVGLHYVNHGADSEYLDIRKAVDPLP